MTWSKSKIGSKEEFYRTILPAGVRMFGGRELHQDGTPHYHVVFSFTEKVHWRDAAKRFAIEEDTNAIRFEKPRARQRVSDFLENTIAYCAKDGDTFGERSSLDGAVAEQKKRKWQDIIDEPDEGSAWRRVRELDQRAYMVYHPALEKAMVKKHAKVAGMERGRRPAGKFRVPKLMELWMEKKYFIRRGWKGRPKTLARDPMVGKSARAESEGNPVVMNSSWFLKIISSGATYVMVSDVEVEDSKWKEALAEVNSHIDNRYDVDEAVDINNDFGI